MKYQQFNSINSLTKLTFIIAFKHLWYSKHQENIASAMVRTSDLRHLLFCWKWCFWKLALNALFHIQLLSIRQDYTALSYSSSLSILIIFQGNGSHSEISYPIEVRSEDGKLFYDKKWWALAYWFLKAVVDNVPSSTFLSNSTWMPQF